MASIGTVKIDKLETLEIQVKITTEFHIRAWIACKLIKLAAFVLGGQATVEMG